MSALTSREHPGSHRAGDGGPLRRSRGIRERPQRRGDRPWLARIRAQSSTSLSTHRSSSRTTPSCVSVSGSAAVRTGDMTRAATPAISASPTSTRRGRGRWHSVTAGGPTRPCREHGRTCGNRGLPHAALVSTPRGTGWAAPSRPNLAARTARSRPGIPPSSSCSTAGKPSEPSTPSQQHTLAGAQASSSRRDAPGRARPDRGRGRRGHVRSSRLALAPRGRGTAGLR